MMPLDPVQSRQFAIQLVSQLRASGYEALWAGGCVRDQLLGLQPKDYDIATNATPDEIRAVFGHRRTLAIGAAFGVITVLGPKQSGQIEIATFRCDAAYSDGRRPDSVSFSDAREDAKRRDFTVNGLFYDPIDDHVIDYVGGRDDLQLRIIRAIGDPHERFREDKLRMLRAVRIAATLDFAIHPETFQAIRQHAGELRVVSVERITAEMKRVLTHGQRRRGVELLVEANLLSRILPQASLDTEVWPITLDLLAALRQPTFSVALAILLRAIHHAGPSNDTVESICRQWRVSNMELETVRSCLEHESTILAARTIPWPRLQRVLILPHADELLDYCEAVALVIHRDCGAVDDCRVKLALPEAERNPLPLITGDDLKQAGIPPGPAYQQLLSEVRDAQLEGTITARPEAVQLAQKLWEETLRRQHLAE